jgi:NADPH:quinone reductase-like Zn-dependent oxidoreductase
VQLAAYFGSAVTAVCSTSNVDLVRSLGADRVVDYTRDDVSGDAETYDIILDAVGRMPRHGQRALKPGGTFISVKTTTKERPEDLQFLRDLLQLRVIVPVIDRRYPLDEIRDAHRFVEAGHKRGNVVIEVA